MRGKGGAAETKRSRRRRAAVETEHEEIQVVALGKNAAFVQNQTRAPLFVIFKHLLVVNVIHITVF